MIRLTNIARAVTISAALAATFAIPATARAQKQSPARPAIAVAQENGATQPYEIGQLLVVGGKDGNVSTRRSTPAANAQSAAESRIPANDNAANANVSVPATPGVRAKWISYLGK